MLKPHEIRSMLVRLEKTQTALAVELECNRTALASVISRKLATPYIRRGVAEAIGLSFLTVWGEEDPGVDRLPFRPRRADLVTGVQRYPLRTDAQSIADGGPGDLNDSTNRTEVADG